MGLYLIILVLVCGTFIWGVMLYNSLISLREQVENAWAQIDIQLKRRHDLIPSLVKAVRAFMDHERSVLEAITQARAAAAEVAARGNAEETAASEKLLNRALGSFLMMIEQYPDLKASKVVRLLLEDLESTENRIAFARLQYNDCVYEFNAFQQRFPNSLVAGKFGFHVCSFFEINGPDSGGDSDRL